MIHYRFESESRRPYPIHQTHRETPQPFIYFPRLPPPNHSASNFNTHKFRIVQHLCFTSQIRSYSGKIFVKMCQISWNTTTGCGHQWAQITVPCSQGMGFDNCMTFRGGSMSMKPDKKQTYPAGNCPWCDLGGWYDMNLVRMIIKVKPGCQCGPSPSKGAGMSCVII